MAVTKIWDVRGSLDAPIKYVSNEEKTENPNLSDHTEEELQTLDDVIEYAANEDKTEMKYFVSTLNCNKNFARDEFQMVKKRFDKEGGIIAYHGYQSFRPDEVTPQQAHDIGWRMAVELWGDRFQVVIATHVNTRCTHNHFVINSVSFKDGGRYHDCTDTYRRMREVSDRICLEHGLSVVTNPKGKGVNKYLYKMERAGMPTRYNVARQAIDESIELSLTFEEFKSELRKRGYNYRFDPNRKYWTVTPPGWKKAIRIHQLGEDYTKDSIERRIFENDPSVRHERFQRKYYRGGHYNLRRRIDHIMGRSGLEKLYLRYCYELGYLPKYRQNPTRLHILLKEDLLKCDQYSEQAKTLSKHHIETMEELLEHMENASEKLKMLQAERNELRNKERRQLPADEIEKTNLEKKELTAKIKELRHELRICRHIEERSGHVKENLEIIEQGRNRERSKDR